jgi:hypothetical protein
MALGAVAAILDHGGGIRVVVTDEPWTFPQHAGPDEQLLRVPGLVVPVPVPWDMIPWVVRQAHKYALTQLSGPNAAGIRERIEKATP